MNPPAEGRSGPPAPALQHFKVVGVVEKAAVVAPGTRFAREVAGGSCWHCGTSIRICVQAKNQATGEIVDIGTTCAERIGLDPQELKRHLAERFAGQRHLASKAYREQAAAAHAAREAELERTVGPHGTVARFEHDVAAGLIPCEECRSVAPHGTAARFWDGRCVCHLCLAAVLDSDQGLYVASRPVLVDLATGKVVDSARLVSSQWGTSWLVDRSNGRGGSLFVPAFRKQRATVAKRGYTYATAEFLLERTHRRDTPDIARRRLNTPTADDWGEPIAAKETL